MLIYQVSAVYLALLLSAAALLISVLSLFYFRSYLKRRTSQERILSEFRDEVNKILRSIDETTDRDISLIEEREKDLKTLLLDIEKRLKVYIREMEKRRDAEVIYTELGKNRFKINRQLSSREEKSPEAKPDSAYPLPNFKIKPEDTTPAEPPPVSAQIHELLKEGFAPPLIASRLNISIAEVEFAADLLERREN